MRERPNIVLITADQLRKDSVGCYGNTICKTPAIDQLCEDGLRFENAYTVAPVCSPARASLMTGLYPHRHGVMLNTHIDTRTTRGLSTDLPTFSKELKRQGYRTEYFGKWHVSEDATPLDFGFDHYTGPTREDTAQGTQLGENCSLQFQNGKQLVWGKNKVPLEQTVWHKLSMQVAECIHERATTPGEPFFLRFDMIMPHFANVVPEPFASMYDGVPIPEWPNFSETFEDKPFGHRRKHEQWALMDKDWDWWEQVVRMYYADISYLDHCTGMVLKAVEEAGIGEETVVVFVADHGDSTGSHKHFEKGGTMYDEVMNVPLIIRWPGAKNQKGICNNFVRNMDLMPTFISAAGGEIPQGIDANDLSPLIRGDSRDSRIVDSAYCEYHGDVWGMYAQRMVVTEELKYVFNPYDRDELYDRKQDPYEKKNLAYVSAYSEQLEEMRARMAGWFREAKDVFTYDFVLRNFPEPIMPSRAEIFFRTE